MKFSAFRLVLGICVAILLLVSLSAFRFDQNRNVTRIEFAKFLAEVMKKDAEFVSADGVSTQEMPGYIDLSKAEFEAIAAVVQRSLLSGYPDGRFYPGKSLTQIELLQTLKAIFKQASQKKAGSRIRGKITEILGADCLFDENYSGFFKGSVFKREALSAKVSQNTLNRLKSAFGLSEKDLKISEKINRTAIHGLVLDALSKKPIKSARLFINNQQVNVDAEGKFEKSLDAGDTALEFFVDSPHHQSLFLRRRADENGGVFLRLKPDYRNLIITAKSNLTGKQIKKFQVSLNGKTYKSSSGKVKIGKIYPGRKELTIFADGYFKKQDEVLLSKKENMWQIAICPKLSDW